MRRLTCCSSVGHSIACRDASSVATSAFPPPFRADADRRAIPPAAGGTRRPRRAAARRDAQPAACGRSTRQRRHEEERKRPDARVRPRRPALARETDDRQRRDDSPGEGDGSAEHSRRYRITEYRDGGDKHQDEHGLGRDNARAARAYVRGRRLCLLISHSSSFNNRTLPRRGSVQRGSPHPRGPDDGAPGKRHEDPRAPASEYGQRTNVLLRGERPILCGHHLNVDADLERLHEKFRFNGERRALPRRWSSP